MIAFLNGVLAGKTQDTAFIDVGGVGYAVGMASGSLAKLPETGERVLVHTHLYVREDAVSLFGFLSLEEKSLFLRLNSVSGIGPKVALSALSVFSPQQLAQAIASQDIALVSRIPGVGKKTASRIILELKGSLDADLLGDVPAGAAGAGSVLQGIQDALLSMGFTSAEIEVALKGAPEDADEGVLLQYALKRLGE